MIPSYTASNRNHHISGALPSCLPPTFSTAVAFVSTVKLRIISRPIRQASQSVSQLGSSRSGGWQRPGAGGGHVTYDEESGSTAWEYDGTGGASHNGRSDGSGGYGGGYNGGGRGRGGRGGGPDRTGQYREARRQSGREGLSQQFDQDTGEWRGGDGGGQGRDRGNYGGGYGDRSGRGQRRGRGGRGGGRGRSERGGGRGRGGLDSEMVRLGKELAGRIKEQGYNRDWKGILASLEEGPKNAIVCTVAISALGKIGKWHLALDVLNDMGVRGDGTDKPRPDAFVYAAAINACGKAGKPVEAVALLKQMGERLIQPDEVCYGATIAALSEVASRQTRSTWGAGEPAAEKVVAPPPSAKKFGERKEDDADHADMDPDHGASSGSDVLNGADGSAPGVVAIRAHEKAVALVQQMREDGPRPNEQCFASAITACARAGEPKAALRLLGAMRDDGVAANSIALNAAVDACGKGGAPDEALRLLRGMERAYGIKPSEITYNSAIAALSRTGRSKEARALLDEMPSKGLKADRISYTAAMQGFATAGDSRNAGRLTDQMRSSGVEMDVVAYGTAISACAKAGDVKGAMKLLEEMQAAGLEANVIVYNTALDACAKAGKPKMAEKLLDTMIESGLSPDATSFTGAIAACARVGDGDSALEWLRVMMNEGIAPEAICYNYAMSACGKSGKGEEAAWIMSEMRRQGVTPNKISYSAAMFALGKAGRLNDVLDLLSEMHREGITPDEVTYHIAVDAASIAGNLGVAMDLFRDMRARGLAVTKRRVAYIRDKVNNTNTRPRKTKPKRSTSRDNREPSQMSSGIEEVSVTKSIPDVKRKELNRRTGERDHEALQQESFRQTRSHPEDPDLSFLDDLNDRFAVTSPTASSDPSGGRAANAESAEDANAFLDSDSKFSALSSAPTDDDSNRDLMITSEIVDSLFVNGGVVAGSPVEPEAEATDEDLTVPSPTSVAPSSQATTITALGNEYSDDTPSAVESMGVADDKAGERGDDDDVDETSSPDVAASLGDGGSEGDVVGDPKSLEAIRTMKATDLKVQLRAMGLKVSGNKADLLARLEEALQQT